MIEARIVALHRLWAGGVEATMGIAWEAQERPFWDAGKVPNVVSGYIYQAKHLIFMHFTMCMLYPNDKFFLRK